MSRYIDANEKLTITVYDDEHEENIDHYMTIEEILDTYTSEGCPPTADVVEIVRCKDCTRQMICFHSDDYFCADGERREDDKRND